VVKTVVPVGSAMTPVLTMELPPPRQLTVCQSSRAPLVRIFPSNSKTVVGSTKGGAGLAGRSAAAFVLATAVGVEKRGVVVAHPPMTIRTTITTPRIHLGAF